MALGNSDLSGKITKCSYKRVTMVICAGNLVFALYVLYVLLSPLYVFSYSSASLSESATEAKFSEAEIRRMRDSAKVRQASEPVDLILRVKEIEAEALREDAKSRQLQSIKDKLAQELLSRLKDLEGDNNTEEAQAVEEWRKKKLLDVKKDGIVKNPANSTEWSEDSDLVAKILETDWALLLEEIGLPISSKSSSAAADNGGKLLQKAPEIEDGIIPGRPLPAECNARPHTDYDGVAVRWGLTHHKESAADCCQACMDQSRNAKDGEKKCNIWVYCPSEAGCYSPDIYEHKHQECWLKQADHPKLNFKGKYSDSYRQEHPRAPVVVPWVSGVIG